MTTKKQKNPASGAETEPRAGALAESSGRKRLGNKLRKVAGVAAVSLAVAKGAQYEVHKVDQLTDRIGTLEKESAEKQDQLDRQTAIIANQNNISPGVITGESLNAIEDLTAYESHVSPEQRELLSAATVEIGKRLRGTADTWQLSCTATKVTNGSEAFVMSAAHCFIGDLPSTGKGGIPDALNITDYSSYEYAILDPNTKTSRRPESEPLALATAVTIDESMSDMALLRVEATPNGTFDKLPAVSFESFTSLGHSPAPGEQAALYAIPAASNFTPVIGVGTYLGRIQGNGMSQNSYELDLVAVRPENETEDPCMFGASGSSAVFAGGRVSGALSIRNNTGYGTSRTVISEDIGGMTARLLMESELGLDLGEVTTVCGFSVPGEQTFKNLQASLDIPGAYVDPTRLK